MTAGFLSGWSELGAGCQGAIKGSSIPARNGMKTLSAFSELVLAALVSFTPVDWGSVYRGGELDKFTVHTEMNANVGILRIFPGITSTTVSCVSSTTLSHTLTHTCDHSSFLAVCSDPLPLPLPLPQVHAFLQPPMEGAVLLSFGAGNVPSNNQAILDELKAACERGVVIVNCSQCSRGHVNDKYEAGKVCICGVYVCMCMYLCTYVLCVCVCVFVCVHACISVCTCITVCVCL